MGPGPFDPSEATGPIELLVLLFGVMGACVLIGGAMLAVEAAREKREKKIRKKLVEKGSFSGSAE